MDLKLKLWIRDIAERLCEGSSKVENLGITLEGDVLHVKFKECDTELVLSEVYNVVTENNIDPDYIRKYMIDEISKNLRNKVVGNGIDDLLKYLK